MQQGEPTGGRKAPSERDQYRIWGAAAGRCTLCNTSVLDSETLGDAVPIGEMAHIVGATDGSPRGMSDLSRDERALAENLMLVCRNCHKPIDDKGSMGRWTIDELVDKKLAHETRVRMLTDIDPNRRAFVLRMVGDVRGVPPELTRETVLMATATVGYIPQPLPRAHWEDIELDLRSLGEPIAEADFVACTPRIDDAIARIHDGVQREDVYRIAVFGFARIPLLVYLGAQLDDKLQAVILQRHRTDDGNPWQWPALPRDPAPVFEIAHVASGSEPAAVAVTLSLSGTIHRDELPAVVDDRFHVYDIAESDGRTGTDVIDSPAALSNIEATLRELLATIERDHGKIRQLHVFPAVGNATAITLGRVLMSNVSPALIVYDRDGDGHFFKALEVQR
jgi:hypothetical protein